MNQIREIVTKAVVGKGKKKIEIHEIVRPENRVYSVLGAWIINHVYDVSKDDEYVIVKGQFEINVWYSLQNNSATEIARKMVYYENRIKTKQVVSDYIEDSEAVEARIIEHPNCKNAVILNDEISVDISLEILAEVIGETKIQVSIMHNIVEEDEDLDFENIINEDFLVNDEKK